ncbi:hypothetical protein TrVFT333_004328 [Trichoderma virens FT-333]|nr:hypothetical protein TrVFT333_004328 [Trichoderma virens FT-333]
MSSRPEIVGPQAGPESPYPYKMEGKVISGFGRGSKEPASAPSGAFTVFPMVMSIGYNPFYKNTVRSAEVHILHGFGRDFYDAHMRLLILGFIREEKDYKSLEALIEDINVDCEVAKKSLAREGWAWDKGSKEDAEWFVKPL